jgi:hypothetical protein
MESKSKRLVKGSEEAKAHMTHIRSLRGKNKTTETKPETEIICPPCENKPKRNKKDLMVDFS